jgi:predicted DNA-binding transcriptional regulator AlpA
VRATPARRPCCVASGHQLVVRDLRGQFWSNVRLLEFLADLPVAAVVQPGRAGDQGGDPSCPSNSMSGAHWRCCGTIPLLIRRPLLQVGEERRVGFDVAAIDAWIGLRAAACRRPRSLPARSRRGTYLPCADGGWRRLSLPLRRPTRPMRPAADLERAVPVAAGVHWIGAFDPDLRSFDIILRTANGTSYNAYVGARQSTVWRSSTRSSSTFPRPSFAVWSRLPTTTRSPPSSSITSNPIIPAPCRNCCGAHPARRCWSRRRPV